jgi:hypothetical protein
MDFKINGFNNIYGSKEIGSCFSVIEANDNDLNGIIKKNSEAINRNDNKSMTGSSAVVPRYQTPNL